MVFEFPKDTELFHDLDTVRAESASWYEVFIYDRITEETFGKQYREILEKQKCEDLPSVHTTGRSAFEAERKAEEKIQGFFRERFDALEAVADQWAEEKIIGSFPNSYMYKVTYVDSEDPEDKDEYTLDYFDEMNRATGFMYGRGRVGSFLCHAKEELDVLMGKKPKLISGITLILLLVGAVVCLAGAMPFAFLPQTVAELMNTSLAVRLVVLAAMALTGWFLVMVGPPNEEVKGNFLFKFFANGIFLFLIAIGSTLIAMRSAFSEVPMKAIELLPFGLYYIIYGLFSLFKDVRFFFEARKNRRQTNKDFCTRVEDNIQHMHRYIRFHTLWWKAQKGDAALPSGIQNLEKSFDHLLKMYKKYG